MSPTLTILLVEDNEDDLTLFRSALKKAEVPEVNLLTVSDGEEAVAYLRESPVSETISPIPHVVLLDLNMPRRNGFEVLQWIRDDPRFSLLTVHVLTTSARQVDVEQAYALRANSYIVKPSHISDLVAWIQAMVAWHKFVSLPKSPSRQGTP